MKHFHFHVNVHCTIPNLSLSCPCIQRIFLHHPKNENLVKNDLMIRLSELPFWIDEAGSFDEIHSNNCTFDYWTEESQFMNVA